MFNVIAYDSSVVDAKSHLIVTCKHFCCDFILFLRYLFEISKWKESRPSNRMFADIVIGSHACMGIHEHACSAINLERSSWPCQCA